TGQEPGKLIKGYQLPYLRGKIFVVRMSHQLGQSDKAAGLLWLQLGFGIVNALVSLPVVAKVFEQFVRDRLKQSDGTFAELLLSPLGIRVLDHEVKAQQPILKPALDG